MFFDLNVPVPNPLQGFNISKKGKTLQQDAPVAYSVAEIAGVEGRIDTLVHLGYSVLAFSQTVHKRVDAKTHVNIIDPLLDRLRKRPGVVYLKRLNIILDQESEKGFGLINGNVSLLNSYDLLALMPTTHATFSLACLTHSLPSQLTAHIISLPLTLPRLPYHLKHTLVRTAIKNGAVLEIDYLGSLGGEPDPVLTMANAAESGASAKRNWMAASRELIRVTKGKGLLISGGAVAESDLRAPRDIANLISILGLSQDAAHEASTKAPRSLILRAQTRRTYRAVLSEPTVILPRNLNSTDSVENSRRQSDPKSQELDSDPASDGVSHKRQREDSDLKTAPPLSLAKKKKHNKKTQ